jgi:glucose/arabinose dehydrogenase
MRVPKIVLCICLTQTGRFAFASVPAGFTETLITGALNSATAMALAPDGRIFVCEQGGALRIIKDGVLLPRPFVTMQTRAIGERGLLGVAIHPDFAANGWVYVYHTALQPTIHNRITRFTATGDHAAGGSKRIILDLDDLSAATNHNGGALHFRRDGKLYVGVGENNNGNNAQSLSNLLGKILRLNDDGTIPSDNPFLRATSGRNQAIWALGLRNPFSFAFQHGTGRMFINDVGERTWEEINEGVAGANYGWPATEGPTGDPRFRSPLFSYGHGIGAATGCAITGGTFYSPPTPNFPARYVGKYFFGDFCSGWIRYLDPATGTVTPFATDVQSVVDLAVGGKGFLFYLTQTSLRRIGYSGR